MVKGTLDQGHTAESIISTPKGLAHTQQEPPSLWLLDIDTPLLWARREELKFIAIQSAHISAHISHVGTTIDMISEKWNAAMKDFNTKLVQDFAGQLEGNPNSHFRTLKFPALASKKRKFSGPQSRNKATTMR